MSLFLKAKEAEEVTETPQPTSSFESKEEEAKQMDFGWNVTPTAEATSKEEGEVKRYTLEDDMEEHDLDTTGTKQTVSPEQQQQRSKERMSKIQEYTQRLKKADGIQDLENEPAYVRRNIQLGRIKTKRRVF